MYFFLFYYYFVQWHFHKKIIVITKVEVLMT